MLRISDLLNYIHAGQLFNYVQLELVSKTVGCKVKVAVRGAEELAEGF